MQNSNSDTTVLVCLVPAGEAHMMREMREMVAELVRMADEFNQMTVSRAAESLTKKLNNSPPEVSPIYRIV